MPLALLLLFADASRGAESRWNRLRSANFEMFSGAGVRSARETIREFEQVRGFFLQATGRPPAKQLPVRLVLFGSQKEYAPYRINEFASAYYHQTAGRDYIVMSHAGPDMFPIAVHEYVHLLARHAGLKLPPWLNEGLAELYSTLRPMGSKILIGDLIAGRYQALLQDKWVPLTVILAVDQNSPYYNEKNKAGSLYNEGWALTHMLFLRAEYRDKFGEFLKTVSAGKDSPQALLDVYGRSVAQIENDLRSYLRGGSFQGVLLPAQLEKESEDIPVEALPDFDRRLMFADLTYRPGKESAVQTELEQLVQEDSKRPEPYRGLGYLAWRRGDPEEAVKQFDKAYERGDRDARLLWDYGRLLEQRRGPDAISVLSALLLLDASRTDVRLELAENQVRAKQAKAALATLAPIQSIPPADAQRFFRIAVYAHLGNGDRESAEKTAKRFRDIAKSEEDKNAADVLVRMASLPKPKIETEQVQDTDAGRPVIRRAIPPAESQDAVAKTPDARPSVSGRFVRLDCQGKLARMILETAAGRKVFLIDDAGNIAITSGSHGPVDMACGPQTKPQNIEVGYDKPAANQPGVDGIVRTIAF